MSVKENTVSAENQMVNSSNLSFLGNPNAPIKILVLGNSITRHGPKADIGWEGDWGMAASAPDKDYVHLLYKMCTAAGQDVYMRIRQSAHWERNFLDKNCLSAYADDRDFGADLIIFRLGDNVAEENAPYFQDALNAFMTYLGAKPGKVIFSTCWWDRPELDEPIRQVAKDMGCPCAETLCADPSMKAYGKFQHSGVAAHPGDSGMEMIAQKIFACFAEK